MQNGIEITNPKGRKIRVLQVLWTANFGGVERLVCDLCGGLEESGSIECGVLFAKSQGPLYAQFDKLAIEKHVDNLRHGVSLSTKRYRRFTETFRRYDVLHLHFFNPFIALAARASNRLIVYTVHGNFHFRKKLKIGDVAYAGLQRRFLNHDVSYMTFNSQFARHTAEDRFGLEEVPRSVVYNGSDLNRMKASGQIEPPLLEAVRDKFVVGTVGRFAEIKRLHLLIQAFAEFQEHKPAMLLLVGDGPLRTKLESQVDRLGIRGKVIFTGYRENVADFQERMDLCVFPSYNESFGLVAVEALALGKPAIVMEDGGGIVEVVGEVSREDVVRDVPALVDRMEYYFRHPEYLQALAQERRSRAEHFSIDRMASQFSEIYQNLALERIRSNAISTPHEVPVTNQ